MPDSKHLRWVDDYSTDSESKTDAPDESVPSAEPAANDAVEPAANDADGWQQYRQWISKAPAPRGRRVGIDPALYTWKGYRNWSEQVKRNWEPDGGDDTE
jgi:hypothetical protein